MRISIHALLAESDVCITITTICIASFLSTLSLRRATAIDVFLAVWAVISIHALLAESDAIDKLDRSDFCNFYPRSPCGERPDMAVSYSKGIKISIHALLAESDRLFNSFAPSENMISIHALLAESDPKTFQTARNRQRISIHALLAESDSKSAQNSGALLRIWNKFYGDCIFMLTGKAVFYPFCPCFFHIFWCEGTRNFMIAFPSH